MQEASPAEAEAAEAAAVTAAAVAAEDEAAMPEPEQEAIVEAQSETGQAAGDSQQPAAQTAAEAW